MFRHRHRLYRRLRLRYLRPLVPLQRVRFFRRAFWIAIVVELQALAQYRWKLRDLREADSELWPDIPRQHSSRSGPPFGGVTRSGRKLFKIPRRCFGVRLGRETSTRTSARSAHRVLCEIPTQASTDRLLRKGNGIRLERARTKVLGLENIKFEVPFEGFKVVGEPDRIDEHPDGLFILDYKTASTSPSGTDILENGYRLQLPFYAIASQKMFGKSALGFQFVQLDKKGTRSAGSSLKGPTARIRERSRQPQQ